MFTYNLSLTLRQVEMLILVKKRSWQKLTKADGSYSHFVPTMRGLLRQGLISHHLPTETTDRGYYDYEAWGWRFYQITAKGERALEMMKSEVAELHRILKGIKSGSDDCAKEIRALKEKK